MDWISGTQRGLDLCEASGGCVVALALCFLIQAARAEDSSPELVPPPVCSPLKPKPPELKDYCEIKDSAPADCHPISPGAQCHKIKVNLTANMGKKNRDEVEVGGYKVLTEHYNNSYLTPVIEALPGDTVAARLENQLESPPIGGGQTMANENAGVNPTNLHFFHGGIVTPRNARPLDARDGTGDNIYVWRKNGADNKPFDFSVPIPGEDELDARVLEGEGKISHPNGLNWYHSHLHGKSSTQVMGGMSGLLSVGDDKAAVKAQCKKGADFVQLYQCNADTEELQKRTIPKYAILRDISLKQINASPMESNEAKKADWDPETVDFERDDNSREPKCFVWKTKDSPPDSGSEDPKLRKGFCQRDQNSAWLFTLNGQRFPTITVDGGQNLLLRLGNLSPNVAYWLELVNETTRKPIPLTILSLDGVVPAKPVDIEVAKIPVDAISTDDLLLMPASRAEIYVRNDKETGHRDTQIYILRTKGLKAGSDHWPEIELARIELKPSPPVRGIALALNVPIETFPFELHALPKPAEMPHGCVRDLNPDEHEHRRVTFKQATSQGLALKARFGIKTEIVKPPEASGSFEEIKFKPDPDPDPNEDANVDASFEEYEIPGDDGSIDWEGKLGPNHGHNHVCIHLDHEGSHKQLWVLNNETGILHNFHIHQMKFRLATLDELLYDYHVRPPRNKSHTCVPGAPDAKCENPDYKLYDPSPNPKTIWHDTIPVPDGKQVFLIMSFDAPQQIGRFVYHCHILKHEDKGLMAPIEVWGP